MVDNVGMRRLWPALFLAAALSAAPSPDPWAALRYLAGEWKGEGGGAPGQASAGGFTFHFDLQGKVFVRTSFAEYPAAAGRPAFRHDDLMVIYEENGPRAIYFDNEDHVIRYRVIAATDAVTFVSDPAPSAPRYRLTYRRTGAATVSIRFEIAPSGKPEAFAPYLDATARRVTR